MNKYFLRGTTLPFLLFSSFINKEKKLLPQEELSPLSPLYTDGLFHCYILDESIFHFRGARSVLSLLFRFGGRKTVSKHCRPCPSLHYVASVLGLHCLPMTLLRV